MERKIVKTPLNSKAYEIKQNDIFAWSVEKEEMINEHMICLTFVRDENLPHLEEIKGLEKQFNKVSKIPLWLLVIFTILTVTFFTIFLIIYFVNGRDVDMPLMFFSLLLPGIVCLFALGALGMIRTKDTTKYISSSVERFEKYKAAVTALLENK